MNAQRKTRMYQRIFNPSMCRILIATCLSVLCLIALSTQAATITVMNTNDSGAGSLRQALMDAANADRITFDSSLNGQTITLANEELLVDKSVTINGPGSDNLTVDGNHGSRVFHVSRWVSAAIAGLTITNGEEAGGGIYNDHATLAVDNCTVSGNHAGGGGGVFNDGSNGSATLTVTNSTFTGNSGNAPFSVGSGGGIFNSGNSGSATLTVTNSTFSGNWAGVPGEYGWGGGIYNYGFEGSATLTVTNSTFSGNSAGAAGGGIYNSGGTVTIGGTILKTGASGENLYNAGTIISSGYNLSNDNGAGLLTAIGDQINTDPMLGPLQDNGGPTFTHAPLTGSPAIDAGKNFTAGTTDQRGAGFVRTFDDSSIANANGGDGTDIGAFEVQAPPSQYAASIQQPINADGTSVFNGRRGVVPVKFTLTLGGVATCTLPPATIAVTRTAGGVIGPIDESDYNGSADNGSNFRIANCQYAYNLSTGVLGVGTYRVDIIINGQVVGSATFGLR
jgi:Chlamydia polymorphic membrane protein (Chlamydia_PMP) repeat